MKIKYVGPFDVVVVPLPYGGEATCERMHLVEVPDSLGESLLEQESNWQPAPVVAKKPSEKPEKPADGGDAA